MNLWVAGSADARLATASQPEKAPASADRSNKDMVTGWAPVGAQPPGLVFGSSQRAHFVSVPHQRIDGLPADRARSASDEHLHRRVGARPH